jgi:hypothetical protein
MFHEKFVSLKAFPDAKRRRRGRFHSGIRLSKKVRAGSSGSGRNNTIQGVALQ